MPDFSRRHYKQIAQIIRESDYDIAPLDNLGSFKLDKERVYRKFCELFQRDNSLFDEEKFAEACGMNWKKHLEKAYTL